MTRIGFVGGGRIARIMLEGWKRAGALPADVKVMDADAQLAARLAADFANTATAALDAVARQDVVIIALHPPLMAEVLPRIASALRPDAVVLSLAPKPRFAGLSRLLGGFSRLARQNPNAPSIIGRGFNPIAFAGGLDEPGRGMLLDLVAPLGSTPVVAEETIEAYALISAMGPTYLWFQFDVLRQLAAEFGLSETAARQAVAAMVHGAATTLLESDLEVDQVLDLVPVKPLGENEAAITAFYRDRLVPLYAKLIA
ncbi:MAG: NAD(P)-binding domain-containing protein [Alphaproteobacteria bacterium]|nr:NAD(P)-binding domain-containing protein [Alphaproteobacteria bacterium]